MTGAKPAPVANDGLPGLSGSRVPAGPVDLAPAIIFLADANGDGHVTPDEFQAFSMGFEYLAQVREKLPQFRAAKAAIFQRWDANKTGFLIFQDYRAGILGDLTRAAAKGGASDGKLSVDELKNADVIRELTAALQ